MIVSVEESDKASSFKKSILRNLKKLTSFRSGCLSSLSSLSNRPSSRPRTQPAEENESWSSDVFVNCGFLADNELDAWEKDRESWKDRNSRQSSWSGKSDASSTLRSSMSTRWAPPSSLWSSIDLDRDREALQTLQQSTLESLLERRPVQTTSLQNQALNRVAKYGHLTDRGVLQSDQEQTASYVGEDEQQSTQYEFASAPWSFGTMDDPEAAATLLESLRYQVNKRRYNQGPAMPPLLDIRDTLNYVVDRGSNTLTSRQWDISRCRSKLDYATESLKQLDLDNSKFVEPGYNALRQQTVDSISALKSKMSEMEGRDRRMARAVEVAETCLRSVTNKAGRTATAENVRSSLATALSK